MMWPQFQIISEIVISRVLNSLPEGVLIALFSWMILRLLPRQNSGTRFAVWFVALLAVAALPVAGMPLVGTHFLLAAQGTRPVITLPGPWSMIFLFAWFAAASIAMFRLTVGLWQLRRLRKSCSPLDESTLDPAKKQIVAEFHSSRSLTIATSKQVDVPTAMGFFQPTIVIPVWALRELTPSELNVVLLHEFAHLRRGDAWTNLLQKIVRAVFLFHPAVWWIERRLSLEREMACDDQVLAEMANPHGYAKCLVALLEKSVARRSLAMAQAAVHRAREAALRLAQILDAGRPNSRSVWKPALALVGTFSLLCLMVVPRAPQFVSFAPEKQPLQTAPEHSAVLRPSPISAPVVIPAAINTASSLPAKKIPQQAARAIAHLPEQQPPSPHVIAARWNAGNESTKQNAAPATETLLIIRTTQRVGPNSWVWSVAVWRLNFVTSSQDEAARGPVAKKT